MITVLLSRLEKVTAKGKNNWMACCPAHEDKTPSLALHEDHNGLILIKCFAGCEVLDVLAAVDMQMEDLFPNGSPGNFRSWQRLEDEYKNKQGNKELQGIQEDVLVLEMARQMRKRGERLSKTDLDREQVAYKKVRSVCR